MMKASQAGFQEIEHTADWALRVWAPDVQTLFVQAAVGMNTLGEIRLENEPRVFRQIDLEALDLEGLLVAFLSEVLYFGEHENLGFDTFEVEIKDNHLRVEIRGAQIASRKKEIKAVTYHNLQIVHEDGRHRVEIVFDV
jgi:SHS2 domain-containing protein